MGTGSRPIIGYPPPIVGGTRLSQPLIVGSIAIGTTNTIINQIQKHEGSKLPRTVFGGFAVAVGLLFLSELSDDLATSLALLIMVASLVGSSGALANLISKLTQTQWQAIWD